MIHSTDASKEFFTAEICHIVEIFNAETSSARYRAPEEPKVKGFAGCFAVRLFWSCYKH